MDGKLEEKGVTVSSIHVAHKVLPAYHAAHTVAAVTAVRVSIVGNIGG